MFVCMIPNLSHYYFRPITVVSGPEIMDKYVGSSEMKLREIFDTPPEIYERYRTLENAPALAKAVRYPNVHVSNTKQNPIIRHLTVS